jgi:hypothetical protein
MDACVTRIASKAYFARISIQLVIEVFLLQAFDSRS